MRTLALCAIILLAFPVDSSTTPVLQDESAGTWLLESCQIVVKYVDNPDATEGKFEPYRDGFSALDVRGSLELSKIVAKWRV